MILKDLLAGWRNDGYGYGVLELWLLSFGTDGLETFVAGSTVATFADIWVWSDYGGKDNLTIIDRWGRVAYQVNLQYMNLSDPTNRATFDGWVRALLP